jgi:molybdopterin-containing oxidoreductase family membrane subunit
VIITRVTLEAERNGVAPPTWIRSVIVLSIPWAICIHTVTAFLYNGLPGRSFWLTAMLVPRFLASAFASGPALLILLCLALRRWWPLRIAREAIGSVAVIVAYATAAHVFFLLLEMFTAFYSQIPEHVQHFRYLYAGLDGHAGLVPWMWTSAGLAVSSLVLLVVPATRARDATLAAACAAVFVSLWIDKGLGLIVGGFVPSPLGAVADYVPTAREVAITAGVWAIGAAMVTGFFKITADVRASDR